MMTKRGSSSPRFKARTVVELISGEKGLMQASREHEMKTDEVKRGGLLGSRGCVASLRKQGPDQNQGKGFTAKAQRTQSGERFNHKEHNEEQRRERKRDAERQRQRPHTDRL
jgi:hypothetical protein